MLPQIIQEATAFSDDLQQPAAGSVIFAVRLEVLGEVGNPFAKQGDLDFRGTGIGGVNAIPVDNASFVFLRQTHLIFNFLRSPTDSSPARFVKI